MKNLLHKLEGVALHTAGGGRGAAAQNRYESGRNIVIFAFG
jgi:hypothetical protein